MVDIVFLRKTLKEAFEEVVNATTELKFVVKNAKINFKDELTTIKVNVDRALEDQFLKLDNKLTTLYKLQNLDSNHHSNHPRASPRIAAERAKTTSTTPEVPAKEVEAKTTTNSDAEKEGEVTNTK